MDKVLQGVWTEWCHGQYWMYGRDGFRSYGALWRHRSLGSKWCDWTFWTKRRDGTFWTEWCDGTFWIHRGDGTHRRCLQSDGSYRSLRRNWAIRKVVYWRYWRDRMHRTHGIFDE